jgi:hypothetical protein
MALRTFSLDFFVCLCGWIFITSKVRAPTKFPYGSHYFWRQSIDNSETRWQDLIMWSMLIYVSYMLFDMDKRNCIERIQAFISRLAEFQWTCLQQYTAVWVVKVYYATSNTSAMADTVWYEEDSVTCCTYQSINYRLSGCNASLRMQFSILYRYIFYKEYTQRIIFISTFVSGFYIKLHMNFVLCIWDSWGNIHTGWSKQFPQLTWMSTGQSPFCSMLFYSTIIYHQHLCWNHRWSAKWTIYEG